MYLLVSHGHGNFHSYIFNENLEFSRSLTLGTRYFKFSIFKTNDKIEKILCSTECPTIIHSKNNHLLFSVLDQKDIQLAIQFNQDYVALADSTSFKIATIDVNLKLQFKKHDIDGDTAVRISYQQGTLTFGVGCTRILEDKGKGVDVVGTREVSFFKLYEQESFKGNHFIT